MKKDTDIGKRGGDDCLDELVSLSDDILAKSLCEAIGGGLMRECVKNSNQKNRTTNVSLCAPWLKKKTGCLHNRLNFWAFNGE